MIDLTPLDVRKKRGDFRKGMRGYDPNEVDQFLEMVAERLEAVVKENLNLKEQTVRLTEKVQEQGAREGAVHEALVTAQELREEIRGQARREAESIVREAESESQRLRRTAKEAAHRTREDAERALEARRAELRELARARKRFLLSLRKMLEREFDVLEMEEGAEPERDFPREVLDGPAERHDAEGRDGIHVGDTSRSHEVVLEIEEAEEVARPPNGGEGDPRPVVEDGAPTSSQLRRLRTDGGSSEREGR